MREEFEKLPEIKERLDGICWNDDLNIYQTEYPILFNAVGFINGALYAHQEQQKKIDAVLNLVCKLQHSSGERIYSEVKELLE